MDTLLNAWNLQVQLGRERTAMKPFANLKEAIEATWKRFPKNLRAQAEKRAFGDNYEK